MTEDLTRCGGKRCWQVTRCVCCSAVHDGCYCTLPRGHDGPHVACVVDHDYFKWPNESAPPIVPKGPPIAPNSPPRLPIDTAVTNSGEIIHLPSLELRAKIAAGLFECCIGIFFSNADAITNETHVNQCIESAVSIADRIIAECRRTQGGEP